MLISRVILLVGATEDPGKTAEGTPPPVANDVKSAVKEAAGQTDGSGLHASGSDPSVAPTATKAEPKVKTEKECEGTPSTPPVKIC